MNNSILVSAALLAALMGPAALAAGSAVVEGGDGTERHRANLEFSGDKLRVETQGQAEGVMIVRDGAVYAVTNGMVIDMGSMMGMLGQQRGMQAPKSGPEDIVRYLGLDTAGRNETIAGVTGTVHVLRYEDGQGRVRSDELVLSKDSRARELSAALETMATTFQKSAGRNETPGEAKLRAEIKGQGVLRYGGQFRVISFGAAPAASRFELPSAPQKMPSFGGGLPGGTAAATPEAGDGKSTENVGGRLSELFGGKMQRQQERAQQRGDSEVDQATDKAVDSVLDKAFNKIFGN